MQSEPTSVDDADRLAADISQRIDAAVDELQPAYVRNKRFAFWHDVGLTGLGALATVLAGTQTLVDPGSGTQVVLRVLVLCLTATVTVFAACNQFFKFKSRTDACLLALRNVYDVRDELALIRADQGGLKPLTEERALALRRAIQKAIKDADLPLEDGSIWWWRRSTTS
jgi:hypothetical protein